MSNLYPFTSKSTIKAQLEASHEFRLQAMVILFTLQTDYEQSTDTTVTKNRQGFMSSHAVNGSRIARKLIAKEELSLEDEALVCKIAPCYSRQLARHFRSEAIKANPALEEVAKVFSANC